MESEKGWETFYVKPESSCNIRGLSECRQSEGRLSGLVSSKTGRF